MPKKKRPKLRRRPYGTGSLFLRSDQRIGWGWQHAGIKYQGSEKTLEAAEAALDDTRANVLAGEDAQRPEKITFKAFAERWLDLAVRPHLSPATLKKNEDLLKSHLYPAFGDRPLQSLTLAELQAFVNALPKKSYRGRPLGPTSALQAIRVLSSLYKYAVLWGVVKQKPTEGLISPSYAPPEAQAYDEAEVGELLAAFAGHRALLPVALAVLMGLRISEIVHLRRGDFSEDWSKVEILGEMRGGRRKTKTPAGRRRLTVPPSLIPLLITQWEDRQAVETSAEPALLFLGVHGEPLTTAALRYAYTQRLAQTSLRRLKFHELRHTHGSLLLHQNVPVHVVARQMGHSSATVTLQIYAHVLKSREEDVSILMERWGEKIAQKEQADSDG